MKPITQSERLARIEVLIEERVIPTLDSLDAKVASHERLKQRGAGILVGLSLAFTAIGITLSSWLKDAIKALT